MQITIIAGGVLKSGPLNDLVQEYEKRLSWKVTIKEIPENSHKNLGDLFIEKIPQGAFVVALDERGDDISSVQFAAFIEAKRIVGRSHLCFLIGPADGLSLSLDPYIHKTIAFGKPTWPHLMVRVLLMEQLYRVQQILAGHPYHRI
ncbi:MAG: 23S rRNA (pseudouridine(1915)-N(3))-methyltransferase RlmH [Alphaproteobacteria bacterium]|jgi:23S rRNA (pseudouridine1915-N3)-methyltransferase|nr:23S rRNA (pseudouridine(1915)-N(3))-methyltransferase RlmH [Alphaproteobacteria bacterium]